MTGPTLQLVARDPRPGGGPAAATVAVEQVRPGVLEVLYARTSEAEARAAALALYHRAGPTLRRGAVHPAGTVATCSLPAGGPPVAFDVRGPAEVHALIDDHRAPLPELVDALETMREAQR